ncbi:MAG: DUF2764 family protein [Bacteroidales bacterium]
MIERQYHYLVSGLPNISPEDKKPWATNVSFRKYLEEHLDPDDFTQVRYIFLKEDHQNIISFLSSGKVTEGAGNFTIDDFRDYDQVAGDPVTMANSMPPYMVDVLDNYCTGEKILSPTEINQALAEGYYHFIMENGCSFLKTFNEFDYNLNNLLAFVKAGDRQMDQKKYIAGDSPLAVHLQNNAGKTLVKDPDFEQFDEIISNAGTASFAEEERKNDLLRWRVIEELTLFEDFTIDRVLGYLLQLLIIERWSKLEKEEGELTLRKIIDQAWQEAFEGTGITSSSMKHGLVKK